jgi:hypothetical protein
MQEPQEISRKLPLNLRVLLNNPLEQAEKREPLVNKVQQARKEQLVLFRLLTLEMFGHLQETEHQQLGH